MMLYRVEGLFEVDANSGDEAIEIVSSNPFEYLTEWTAEPYEG